MPIYEYQCGACGHRLEAMQKMTEDPLLACPACGHPALQKLISAAGFQLKGSGWYVTDFKDKGKKKAGDAAQGGAATGDKATDQDKAGSSSKVDKPAES
jgi:putative FmdB family regulatory protein